MRGKNSKSGDVRVEYTSKPLSGWGGLTAFFRFSERVGMEEYLRAGLPDGRVSPNQVRPVDITKGLLATVLTGGFRFAHVDRLRGDEVIRAIVGAERLPGADSVRRYFGGFTSGQSERLCEALQALTSTLLGAHHSGDTLDLDSTVFDRYGEQEGSARGYHPTRHGQKSQHALLAMAADAKQIVHSWLRAGSTTSFRGSKEFLAETLARLPEGFHIRVIRADSGFYSNEFLEFLEERGLKYLIAMRMNQWLTRFCAAVSDWTPINDTDAIAVSQYQPGHWIAPRCVIVIRKALDTSRASRGANATQGTLIAFPAYEYRALVTNLDDLTPIQARRLYHLRGDCENRIKELKNDFNADGFCLRSFAGTEAVLRLNCFLHNLVAEFKRSILRDTRTTLATIRTSVFVIGAALGSSARTRILRLGLTGHWKHEFDLLLERIDAFTCSTAAQLQIYLNSNDYSPPTPWKLRKPRFAFVPL